MVAGPAAAHAIAMARRMPSLRIGLHLVLVEGRPCLPAAAIPDLVDATGMFRTGMARMGAQIFFLSRVRAQMAAEVAAQFQAFAATGLTMDHVNAHKHFHLHPAIVGQVMAMAARYAVRNVRVPHENAAHVARIDATRQNLDAWVMWPWTHMLQKRLRRAGFCTPDQVFGLSWSGTFTQARLLALAQDLPDGLTEIYTHPATSGDFAGAAPFYQYSAELAALADPLVRAALARSGAILGGFGDFSAP